MRPSTVTNIARVIGPSGSKVVALVPSKKPLARAYKTAASYQLPLLTSANGFSGFAAVVPAVWVWPAVVSARPFTSSARTLAGTSVMTMQKTSSRLTIRFFMLFLPSELCVDTSADNVIASPLMGRSKSPRGLCRGFPVILRGKVYLLLQKNDCGRPEM